MPLDPSSADRGDSSKLVIDATRQWPEEGGPEVYPELNRTLLEKLAPDAFDVAMGNWGEMINSWGKTRY
jgi:3-polyprenyl-4-hydroxybenzoate decarboxylase